MDSKLAFVLLLAAASAPCLCAASDPASNPDPDAGAGALAEQRYREGDAAMNRGDFDGARLAFVQAYALDASPRNLVGLATAEARGAHPLEALTHFRQYLRLPSLTEAERGAVSGWMADAGSKTGHIRVETAPGVTITLDTNVDAGVTPLSDPLDVSPGPHRLAATRGALTASTTIAPHAGETVVWQLQWESSGGSAAAAGSVGPGPGTSVASTGIRPSAATPAEPGLTPNGKPLPTTKWIVAASLLGAGLLSFGIAGGVTAAGTNEASKEADLSAETGVCPQPPMTTACAALKSAADAHAADGNVAIGFVAAGGVLAVAAVLALVWPSPRPSTTGQIVPVVAPRSGGAQWIQSF